jgi:type II secretory ATPase GspE/PulE/Tfp pilus assembly ATPase PilB-like protein
LLEVTDEVREAVLAGKTITEVERVAGAADALRQDALAKAASGQTSLDEVARVLGGL